MDNASLRIVNQIISAANYSQRRSQNISRLETDKNRYIAHAHAVSIFSNDGELLDFPSIREAEQQKSMPLSEPRHMKGIATLRNGMCSMEQYKMMRMNVENDRRGERVTMDRASVFGPSNALLSAMEILERELLLNITPLTALPTNQNLETVDESDGTGERLLLSALKGYNLSEEQMKEVLPPRSSSMSRPGFITSSGATTESVLASTSGAEISNHISPIVHSSISPARKIFSESRPSVSPQQKLAEDSHTRIPSSPPPLQPSIYSQPVRAGSSFDTGEHASSCAVSVQDNDQNATLMVNKKLRDIARGNILPSDSHEAEEAAKMRRECLVRKYTKNFNSGKSKRKTMQDTGTMALPPEFAPMDREPDEVYCVCGSKHGRAPKKDWIGCDRCEVWQYAACMGEGVPRHFERKDVRYQCQQCEPFRHRKLLRSIRQREELSDDLFE